MSKILGFIVGALLVFGGLFYLLTPAGFVPDTIEHGLAIPPEVLDVSEAQTQPVPESEESAETDSVEPQTPQPPAPAEPAQVRLAEQPLIDQDTPAAVMEIGDEQALVEQALAAMQESVPPQPESAASGFTGMSQEEPADETQWFAVWEPFHSELSANAFARRLERMTGLDYRVVRSDRAQYEVAVAFGSEEERVANIARIEEATGLRIAGGSL